MIFVKFNDECLNFIGTLCKFYQSKLKYEYFAVVACGSQDQNLTAQRNSDRLIFDGTTSSILIDHSRTKRNFVPVVDIEISFEICVRKIITVGTWGGRNSS